MTKKIFLTSAVIMCMACPAFAENFPGDGNMLENKTYDNAATYANTGIYEGTVVANADYSLNPYSVSAGSYFTGIDNSTNQATTAQCTSGNYCPGVASTTYDNNAFGDTGLRACPANYSGSATGATANTDCYRACATTDITHSTAITGNVYYNGTDGDGTKACTPTSCDNGYHVENSTCAANTINITWNDASAEDIAATGAATTVYEGDIKTPLKAVMKPGKTFVGWKFVKPVATPTVECPYELAEGETAPNSPADIGGCQTYNDRFSGPLCTSCTWGSIVPDEWFCDHSCNGGGSN